MLEIENLTVNYEKNPVLWDVSCSLPQGVICGIAGPNGAGKSTLLKAIMGLIRPLSGKVRFAQKPIQQIRKKIAYIPQRGAIDWDFPITAFDVVLMGRANQFGFFSRPRKADKEATIHALQRLGMLEFSERQIGQLSGGQQQRLFLARALLQEPEFLLMDEPFTGIDLVTEELIMGILRGLAAKGKTIVIVFHDLGNAKRYFDWLLLLNRRLVACGPVSDIFNQENLERTFGKGHALFEEAAHLSAKTLSGLE